MTHRIMAASLLLTLPLALGACGGCGKDENKTENNKTSDMGGDGGNACIAGTAGCACKMDNTCDGDVMCVENMCQGAQSSGLTIQAEAARSCEIMLKESADGRVLGATYAAGVKGSWRRKAPNVALAITLSEDAAFPAGAVSVQFAEGGTLPSVGDVRCFDALGKEVDGASATLK